MRGRPRKVRALTILAKELAESDTDIGRLRYPEETERWVPCTRGDCAGIDRPCPYVACKYNLYIDVNRDTGSIKLNFPDLEPWEMEESCALDIADRGGVTLEEVGAAMNLTRERIRQLEHRALLKLRRTSDVKKLRSG